MELWGFSDEALAKEIKRRAMAGPLPRDHSPGLDENFSGLWVKIPDEGINAGTNDGRTPSITACEIYEPDEDGILQAVLDKDSEPVTLEVRHRGAAISGADSHTYKYMLTIREHGGYIIVMDYCDS